jgi:hypothetical protein
MELGLYTNTVKGNRKFKENMERRFEVNTSVKFSKSRRQKEDYV